MKISVIIPMYNNEKYMRRCIDSVLAQTLKDIEIIIVDDASTDKTWKMLNFYYMNVHKIKKVRHKTNLGTSASRNTGIKLAQGEYITWVDHDDYIEPTYLEVLYNNAKKYDADISACGVRVLWIDNTPSIYAKLNAHFYGNEEILKGITDLHIDTATWGKIVSHKLIEKYKLQFPDCVMEDIIFWVNVCCYAKKYVSTETILYNWCVNSGSQSFGSGCGEKNIETFSSILSRANAIVKSARDNGAIISESSEKNIYIFLISSSIYTMHKYMFDDKWNEFRRLFEEKCSKMGENTEYILALFNLYRKLYIQRKK